MRIFVSWSGEPAKQIAGEISKYLKLIVPGTEVFLSTEGIETGSRWSSEIAEQLEKTDFGIICLNRINLTAPWIMFEAGALSKSIENGRVIPILFGLTPADLVGSPLSQFQSVPYSEAPFKKLALDIASNVGASSRDAANTYFDKFWPDLRLAIDGHLKSHEGTKDLEETKNPTELMLDRISQQIDRQYFLLKNPKQLLPQSHLKSAILKASDLPKELRDALSWIEDAEDTLEEIFSEAAFFDDEDPEEMSEKLLNIEHLASHVEAFSDRETD